MRQIVGMPHPQTLVQFGDLKPGETFRELKPRSRVAMRLDMRSEIYAQPAVILEDGSLIHVGTKEIVERVEAGFVIASEVAPKASDDEEKVP